MRRSARARSKPRHNRKIPNAGVFITISQARIRFTTRCKYAWFIASPTASCFQGIYTLRKIARRFELHRRQRRRRWSSRTATLPRSTVFRPSIFATSCGFLDVRTAVRRAASLGESWMEGACLRQLAPEKYLHVADGHAVHGAAGRHRVGQFGTGANFSERAEYALDGDCEGAPAIRILESAAARRSTFSTRAHSRCPRHRNLRQRAARGGRRALQFQLEYVSGEGICVRREPRTPAPLEAAGKFRI